MTTLIEKIVGDLGDKRRWRQYKARVKALPTTHRTTVEALERYLTYFGAITKGDVPMDVLMSMLEDLADLFEQAAADGTPIRAVVGEDPVEFAETFFRNYSDGQWISKERDRSVSAIEREIHKEIQRGINKSGADWSRPSSAPKQKTGRPAHDGPTERRSGDPRAGPGEVVQAAAGAARRGLRRGAGQHLRPARLQRGGQDHGREDPVHAAQGATQGLPASTASMSRRRPPTCASPSA